MSEIIKSDAISYPFLPQKITNHVKNIRSEIKNSSKCVEIDFELTQSIKKVILILSTPRSGSSLLFDVIKDSNNFLSFDGEHVPYYKLSGLSFPFNSMNSEVIPQHIIKKQIFNDFICDLQKGMEKTSFDENAFLARVAMRLPLQWPNMFNSGLECLSIVNKAYDKFYISNNKWSSLSFWRTLLRILHVEKCINPLYYDEPFSKLSDWSELYQRPQIPPNNYFCLEEPPFILIKPRAHPNKDDINTKPLLLKASIDSYRLDFLLNQFPNAKFYIIQLIRNPASVINGLMDGWLDGGFFSHNLEGHSRLSIEGYSENGEYAKYWWNFDLFPNWQNWTESPLEYVCGQQWYNSSTSILENLSKYKEVDVLKVKFEDFLTDRLNIMNNIFSWLNILYDDSVMKKIIDLPIIMATEKPMKMRWKKRNHVIMPVILQNNYKQLAKELGYSMNSMDKWI